MEFIDTRRTRAARGRARARVLVGRRPLFRDPLVVEELVREEGDQEVDHAGPRREQRDEAQPRRLLLQRLEPFDVREPDLVQYGSDNTKTHRKIKHILGQKQHDKVGRLLVSELFTVGAGGWSGFPPHKHDTDCLPDETRHDEVYNFRFKPDHGFGMQLLEPDEDRLGDAFHIVDGSSFAIKSGYHPCVVAPGYEMYYFTILGGLSQRPLVQYFQPEHSWEVETIPGIKDMIAKFK